MWTQNEELPIEGDAERIAFAGKRGEIFKLALVTTLLTIFTLGIYRFWARTRIRKYIWSNTSLGNVSLEYSGTGLEKFLGFLIALVVLAVYLGVLQVILTFVGINMFGTILSEPGSEADQALQALVFNITFLALFPLILFATYRARRYTLSRTSYRGIRFAMDKSAVKYTAYALLMTLLAIVTFGLAMPYVLFKLEKFMTDRTWFGDAKLTQGGSSFMLYRPCLHIAIGVFATVAIFVLIAMQVDNFEGSESQLFGLTLVGPIWVFLGYIYFQVQSFARLTGHKSLGTDVTFSAAPHFKSMLGIWLIAIVTMIGAFLVVVLLLMGPMFLIGMAAAEAGNFGPAGGMTFLFLGLGILAYVSLLVALPAISLALLSMPIFGHLIGSTVVHSVSEIEDIRQRAGDNIADADGFADALDIGGAF